MAAWPGTLPTNLLLNGYEETLPDNLIRTQMSIGPPKSRKRSTAAVTSIIGRTLLTTAQAATLTTFFQTTTDYGADSWTWTHPRTGAAVTLRFVSPPVLSAVSGGHYYVDLALEILP